jgi:DNA repair protein RecN (Recombination protein N)
MLETLSIRNVAVIDQAEIPFRKGLNILSGETGAGKSIVIEAISLLLGSRATSELVRTGSDEAIVQGIFDVTDIPWINERLEKLGLSSTGPELVIRRTIRRDGKHRVHVNGDATTLAILQELCEGLVDLCGQHEHQTLLKTSVQLELLDRTGGHLKPAAACAQAFTAWRTARRELQALQGAEAERLRRSDYLAFQIQELQEAHLQPGEDETLQREKQLLQSAESRLQSVDAIEKVLSDEDSGVLNGLKTATMRLKALTLLDSATRPALEGLERAFAEVEEASIGLSRYARSVDLDPERLQEVQDRLSLLADLRRKYGATLDEMLHRLEGLEHEQSDLSKLDHRLKDLEAELGVLEKTLHTQAQELSRLRQLAAKTLSDSVTHELQDLKMAEAVFQVDLQLLKTLEDWSASGCDQVQFLVRTNLGEPSRPLGKVASGGELSRLMLAIRRVIADRGGIGVYLFDEIDAGMGGQTAFEVGKKLKSVAAYNQVICITHLPQVASFADHHLVVQKATHGDRTLTRVEPVLAQSRLEELARMLGGPALTRTGLENARELLTQAEQGASAPGRGLKTGTGKKKAETVARERKA